MMDAIKPKPVIRKRLSLGTWLFLYTAFLSPVAMAEPFVEKHEEGWHWYQNPFFATEEALKERSHTTPETTPVTPTQKVKAYQQELEKRLHLAWVNPTHQNIKAYQTLQKDLMGRSQTFSEMWMQVLYQNPQLDHTVLFPVNQKGRHIYLDNEKKLIQETIQSLKDSYGLFFFFKSECAYCKAFAPIVQAFSQNTGWEVLAISVDGSHLEGFESVVDNGLWAQLNPSVLPALFAVNPKTHTILPIAYGLTSLEEMENRIMTLVANRSNR